MIIKAARYAKNSTLCIPEDNIDGWKGHEARLLEALNARYTHRERGYSLTQTKELVLRAMLQEGWTGDRLFSNSQDAVFRDKNDVAYNYAEAKRKLKHVMSDLAEVAH